MVRFQVIQPSAPLAPYVKQYWFLTLKNMQNSQRLMPSGYTALTFQRGDRVYSSLINDSLPQSYLYGITTDYNDFVLSEHIDFICVIFQPVGIKAFFNLSPYELNDSHASLDSLSDPALIELEKRLSDATDNLACVGLIEEFLLQRIYQLNRYSDKRIDAVIQAINKGENNLERLAGVACLSYKQLKRIFTETIGINPKDFQQITRFQKLHLLLQQHSNMTVTQLADECGYYDKSHLIKELKDFSGFTPTQLHEACHPVYSDYHALFRSAFVDLPLELSAK